MMSMKRMLAFIISGVLIGVGVLPAAAQTTVELPAPTGSLPVGRTTYVFTDSSRTEPFLAESNQAREVVARVYYPASPAADAKPAPFAEGLEVDVLTQSLPYPPDVIARYIRSHAYADARLADAAKVYPVVLFAPDIESTPLDYTSLLEDIASHGYIVVALSYPYSSAFAVFPDGRVAFPVAGANKEALADADGRNRVSAVWAADTRFALSEVERLNRDDKRFAGRLDMSNVVLMGAGFGGSVAVDTIAADTRFAGGISLDGQIVGDTASRTLSRPFLFLDPAGKAAPPLQKAAGTAVYKVTIQASAPAAFASDTALLRALFATAEDTRANQTQVQSSLLRPYVVAFLDKYLKGADAPLLDGSASALPQTSIEIETPQAQ